MDLGFYATLYICLLHSICLAQYNKITMGPFDLVIRHLEECPEIGQGTMRFAFKLHRVGRDQFAIDANFTSSMRIDDSLSILYEAAKFGNGGWNEKYFVKEFPQICSITNLAPKFAKSIATAAGYPNGDKCPIKPKNYTIKNLKVDLDVSHVLPMFVYGKYRGDMSIIKNGNIYGCLRIFVDAVPKRVISKKKKKGK